MKKKEERERESEIVCAMVCVGKAAKPLVSNRCVCVVDAEEKVRRAKVHFHRHHDGWHERKSANWLVVHQYFGLCVIIETFTLRFPQQRQRL